MNLQPPIAKGILAAFDIAIDNLRKILSLLNKFHSEAHESSSATFDAALNLFSNITDDSKEEDCFECIKLMRSLPIESDFAAKLEKETSLMDFYNQFRKFRYLVECKLAVPLETWKQAKQDAIHFPEMYEKLVQELDDVRQTVETARLHKDKIMPEQEESEKRRKMISASEDFKSLHPFFIIANSEEHLERISALREKKVQDLEEEQKVAKENFLSSTEKFKMKIQNIIEGKLKNEWNKFSSEMEESRKLSKIYREKHAVYLQIQREKAEKEREGKQEAAATILQAHWRGFMTRRRLKGDVLF